MRSGLEHVRGELRRRAPWLPPSPGPSTDFGGPIEGESVSIETRTLEDVQAVLEVARALNVPVSCRGGGHTSGGHTAAPAGIVLRHRATGTPSLAGELARAPSGLEWGVLEAQLLARELDLPVTTSSVRTTLAGTLSLAGLGVRSVKQGAQVDHVEALQLITADGTLHVCSREQNPDLFCCALTGLGQIGILHEVTLRCIPRARSLSQRTWRVTSYSRLAEQLSGWTSAPESALPDLFCAIGRGSELEVMVANAGSPSRRDAPAAEPFGLGATETHCRERTLADFQAEEREMPPHWSGRRHLWADYCLDVGGFRQFARFVDEELKRQLQEHMGYVLAISNPGRSYALDPRPHGCRMAFSVGLFFSVDASDTGALASARAAHAAALDVCSSLGGRPYLHGVWGGRSGLSGRAVRATFTDGADALGKLRRRLDPDNLLNRHALNLITY